MKEKSRDKKYTQKPARPNFADGLNCSVLDCSSIATQMLYDVLSLCPIHYSLFLDHYHNDNYRKLSTQIDTMKLLFEIALEEKDGKLKQADEAYARLAEEFQLYMEKVSSSWWYKIIKFFRKVRTRE